MLPIAVRAEGTLGIQPTFFAGKHFETNNDVSGTAGGVFFEGNLRGGFVGLHVEGIPDIRARATTSDQFGKPTESIGLLTGDLRFSVDRLRRFYLSIGEALFTQTTPIVYPQGTVYTDSRVVGMRIGGGTRIVWGRNMLEANVVGADGLQGQISYRSPRFSVDGQSERASEVDVSASYGRRLGRRYELLGGVRSINYSASLSDGTAADRNVAVGIFIAGRILLGR